MTPGQIALIVVGLVGLAESSWGISSPAKLKAAVHAVVEDAPPRNLGLGLFFAGLAGLLWLLISPDRALSDWALVVLSWIFAGGSIANFIEGGFRQLAHILILDRPPVFIRSFYVCEFIIACFLIVVAVLGK